MAAQIYPDEKKLALLDSGIPSDLYYWLFTNDITPDDDTVTDDFDYPATTAGVHVQESDFTLSGVAAHVARRTAPDIAVGNESGSPVDAYGYFATSGISGSTPAGGTVLCCRFDDAPKTVEDGDFLPVTPTVALGVC